jgi:hypothetical protein
VGSRKGDQGPDNSTRSRPSDQTKTVPTHGLERANALFIALALNQELRETGRYQPQLLSFVDLACSPNSVMGNRAPLPSEQRTERT